MSVNYKETATTMLKILSDKPNVFFTPRCNESIRIALLMAASLGRVHALMQDEGGWLTYEKYIVQAGLDLTRMISFGGVIPPKELNHYGSDEVLIVNSLAGYIASQDMDEIQTCCITNDILLINDVSGSIGLSGAKRGDIIVGSFGKAKPIDLGTGGFIAFSDEFLDAFREVVGEEFVDSELDFESLSEKLKGLEARRVFLTDRVRQVKNDLSEFDIVHKGDESALNVVVRFDSEEVKAKIEAYCQKNDLEFTVCPREIRILDDAISIEVKRLKSK